MSTASFWLVQTQSKWLCGLAFEGLEQSEGSRARKLALLVENAVLPGCSRGSCAYVAQVGVFPFMNVENSDPYSNDALRELWRQQMMHSWREMPQVKAFVHLVRAAPTAHTAHCYPVY